MTLTASVDLGTRSIAADVPNTSWPIAAEQLATVRLLLDPQTHGGASPGYLETAISHIFLIGEKRLILKRPMKVPTADWRSPQARWSWCTERCMRAFDSGEAGRYGVLPVMRRNGALCLGGPGELEDCVLVCTTTLEVHNRPPERVEVKGLAAPPPPSTRAIGV